MMRWEAKGRLLWKSTNQPESLSWCWASHHSGICTALPVGFRTPCVIRSSTIYKQVSKKKEVNLLFIVWYKNTSFTINWRKDMTCLRLCDRSNSQECHHSKATPVQTEEVTLMSPCAHLMLTQTLTVPYLHSSWFSFIIV